jgi:hypothetical protein
VPLSRASRPTAGVDFSYGVGRREWDARVRPVDDTSSLPSLWLRRLTPRWLAGTESRALRHSGGRTSEHGGRPTPVPLEGVPQANPAPVASRRRDEAEASPLEGDALPFLRGNDARDQPADPSEHTERGSAE